MNIDIAFINSRKFLVLLFFGLFFIGLGYISLLPVFEGFDETAHYSRIREIENSASSMFDKESYIDQIIVDYSGPMPYASGFPPYSHENSYNNFFAHSYLVDSYKDQYFNNALDSNFYPSKEINWQIQHPPFYYFLLSTLGIVSDELPLAYQIFALRLISYLFVLIGVLFGVMVASSIADSDTSKAAKIRLGFLIYPIIFPMFFLEFARIGNDSLCVLFVGVVSYLMSRWYKDKESVFISFAIGITLSLGLITKALFIPIVGAIGFVMLLNISTTYTQTVKSQLFKSYFFIILPICLIAGSWYLFKYFMVGDPGLGFESFKLTQQGGLIHGLKENFNFVTAVRGLIVPFATFFWAGTWSLVRMPLLSYAPLFIAAAWLIKVYIFLPKKNKVETVMTLLTPALLFMYLGLAWHVMIMMGLNGVATSPGWYFHILMPLIAPLLGIAYSSISKKAVFISLLIYSFLFHLSAIVLHALLFGAGAFKGDDKSFVFNQNIYTLDGIAEILDNLTMISFPSLSFISFLLGFLILAYMTIKINSFSIKRLSY